VSEKRPNIVFVLCDQLRQAAVGCYGQDNVVTPTLDRFAEQSLVLTHCLSNQPVCTPYRGMLFSGQWPWRTGLYANCHSGRDIELPDETRCFSDVFADRGYSLGYLGKLHLHKPRPPFDYGEGPRGGPNGTVWDAFTPPESRHGFDFWHSYGCNDRHLDPHYWTGERVDEGVSPHEWSVKHEADVAVEYLRNTDGKYRDAAKPFLLVVSHNPPHPPYAQVPDRYLEPFADKPFEQLLNRPNVQADQDREAARLQTAQYFAAVHGVDEQFGRILDAIDEQGLADDTIVIFTSDHGEMMHSHGLMQKNTWHDESLLIPWLIRWPGRIRPGRDDLLFNAVDVYPTLLGLAGLAGSIPPQVEGADRSGIFLGQDDERPDSALYLWPDWKHYSPRFYPSARGVRTHRHMFVVGRDADGREEVVLHDSETDPYQLRNVAAEHPELVGELRAKLDDWLARTDDPWHNGAVEPHL